MAEIADQLITGIDKARSGADTDGWHAAHAIAQSLEGDACADWFHAILHKIEGDASNSRYWHSRTDKRYETYPDADAELDALKAALQG